jgi:hypothetical protein
VRLGESDWAVVVEVDGDVEVFSGGEESLADFARVVFGGCAEGEQGGDEFGEGSAVGAWAWEAEFGDGGGEKPVQRTGDVEFWGCSRFWGVWEGVGVADDHFAGVFGDEFGAAAKGG